MKIPTLSQLFRLGLGFPLVALCHAQIQSAPQSVRGVIPNDQLFKSQNIHYLRGYLLEPPTNGPLHTTLAWEITTGSPKVTVAILDSGIGSRLLEFAGRLVPGYNFVFNNTDTEDYIGDGTAAASILGANANNPHPDLPGVGLGTVGVDWNCRIMPVKVTDIDFRLNVRRLVNDSLAAAGIDFAVSNGCKVILFSAPLFNDTLEGGTTVIRSIQNAIDKGVIFVCEAGGSARRITSYPAKYPPAIAVGSSTGFRSSFRLRESSNYGPELDLLAPGEMIYVLRPYGARPQYGIYERSSGTTLSAAMVAGVCSLMAAVRPDLTHEQARVLLGAGADDQGGDQRDTPGYDIYYGWGRLNAYNSLVLATTRIDRFERNRDGTVELSWVSPPNAASKRPYAVEAAPAVTGPWTAVGGKLAYEYKRTVTEEGVSSESYRTVWTSGRLDPGLRYFRVRIKLNE